MNAHDAIALEVQKELLTPGFCALQDGARNQCCTVSKPALWGGREDALIQKDLAKQRSNAMNGMTLRHGAP
jgi:hypothetical protein